MAQYRPAFRGTLYFSDEFLPLFVRLEALYRSPAASFAKKSTCKDNVIQLRKNPRQKSLFAHS